MTTKTLGTHNRAIPAERLTYTAFYGYDCYDRIIAWFQTSAAANRAVDNGEVYGYTSKELSAEEYANKFGRLK